MKNNFRTIKFYRNRDFIKVRNNALFFNIDNNHIKIATEEVKKKHHVHIFVTSTSNLINYLERFINAIPDDVPIYIHVPKNTIDNVKIINDIFYIMGNYSRAKILVEKDGPSFAFDKASCSRGYRLNIDYYDDTIGISVQLTRFDITGYNNYGAGAIKTGPMKLKPELFKDKIVDNFKKECPEGILGSFKDDNDIWDYIMMNGEWSVKDEEEDKE